MDLGIVTGMAGALSRRLSSRMLRSDVRDLASSEVYNWSSPIVAASKMDGGTQPEKSTNKATAMAVLLIPTIG